VKHHTIVKQPDANASLSCKTTGEICRIRNTIDSLESVYTIDSLESVWLAIENMLDAYKYCAQPVL
jgi:hypothetical protein